MSLGKINWSNFEGSHEKNGILMNVISFEINWDEWLSLSRYIYIYTKCICFAETLSPGFQCFAFIYLHEKSKESFFSTFWKKYAMCEYVKRFSSVLWTKVYMYKKNRKKCYNENYSLKIVIFSGRKME